MSGMGIYGLSGSGIDVDSMVRMGMMSKQNDYDRMYKKEVKNEWKKEAYTNIYQELNTFNSSTMYNYKLSSTTSPMTASSSNSNVAAAVANADAATMTHTVNVTATASNAYLLTNGTLNRANESASKSIYLKDLLFKESDQAVEAAKVSSKGAEKLFSFTIADGSGKKSEISFTYNDIFTNNLTLNDLTSRINQSGVNVKATYDSANDAFSLYQKTGGSANKIIITETLSEKAPSEAIAKGKDLVERLNLGSVTQTLDASGNLTSQLSDPLSFTEDAGVGTIDDNAAEYTSTLEGLSGSAALGSLFNVSASDGSLKFTITSSGSSKAIEFADASTATVTNLIDKLNDEGLKIEAQLDSSGRLTIKSNAEPQSNISFAVSTDSSKSADNARNLLNALGLSDTELKAASTGFNVSGTDAEVTIDGRKYTSDTAKVTVGNVTYSLASKGSTTVTINQDTDKLVENVKQFVEDYNKMLDKLNDLYYETQYKDYDVLTQNQEKSMTKEQIDKWNEKAKSGLLNHDNNISKIISEMRQAIYTPVTSVDSKYNTMMSIGISSTTDRGHLSLDEDKLKKALNEDPNCVRQLLTSSGDVTDKNGKTSTDYKSEGVAQRISDSLVNNLKTMKSYAGTSTEPDDNSELGNLIRELQTKMSNFKTMMNAYENMLYKKYDAMEIAIQRMGVSLGYITGGN